MKVCHSRTNNNSERLELKSFFRRLIIPHFAIKVIRNLIQFKLPGQNKSSGSGGKGKRSRPFECKIKLIGSTITYNVSFRKQQLPGKIIRLEKIGIYNFKTNYL